MEVLVIEDDDRVAGMVEEGLTQEGNSVAVAADGAAGLSLALENSWDVVVVDVELPTLDGFEVVARLRATGSTTPILMLTGRDTQEDIVRGLDTGADEYLTKPFDFVELSARLRALVRRHHMSGGALRFADVELDQAADRASRAGKRLPLTPTEFKLLRALMLRPGATLGRAQLLAEVWDLHFDPGTNLLDVHMSHLRKKLEAGGRPRMIEAVRGVGFRLEDPSR